MYRRISYVQPVKIHGNRAWLYAQLILLCLGAKLSLWGLGRTGVAVSFGCHLQGVLAITWALVCGYWLLLGSEAH